jgi:hypothetical protein
MGFFNLDENIDLAIGSAVETEFDLGARGPLVALDHQKNVVDSAVDNTKSIGDGAEGRAIVIVKSGRRDASRDRVKS